MKHPAGPIPPGADQLFPADRLRLVQEYADLLAADGVVRGLIGPREVPRLWSRHLFNCALLAEALPQNARVADVGSGAGLPGIVIALARPDLSITLIEPLLRRTTFLEEVVDQLSLTHVTVRRDRADAVHGQERFDVVTARAVAPLERLLGWCMPLVEPHGALLAMKGSSAPEEVEAAAAVLHELDCSPPSITTLGESVEEIDPTRLVRVTWAHPDRVTYPSPGGSSGRRRSDRRNKRRR